MHCTVFCPDVWWWCRKSIDAKPDGQKGLDSEGVAHDVSTTSVVLAWPLHSEIGVRYKKVNKSSRHSSGLNRLFCQDTQLTWNEKTQDLNPAQVPACSFHFVHLPRF